MCEVFPEFENCCFIFSYRIAMLMMSVLAVTTGAITLSAIEQNAAANYNNLKNVTNIRDSNAALKHSSAVIKSVLTVMSVCFMLMGFLLLFATLGDSEGMVQIFVWVIFVNVIMGFGMVLAICFDCIMKENQCILGDLDWLSGSILLIIIVAYLFLWLYFISVANSYVLNSSVL